MTQQSYIANDTRDKRWCRQSDRHTKSEKGSEQNCSIPTRNVSWREYIEIVQSKKSATAVLQQNLQTFRNKKVGTTPIYNAASRRYSERKQTKPQQTQQVLTNFHSLATELESPRRRLSAAHVLHTAHEQNQSCTSHLYISFPNRSNPSSTAKKINKRQVSQTGTPSRCRCVI